MIRVRRLHKEKPEGLNEEPQRIQNPRTIKGDLRVEISLAPRNAPEGLPLNGHNDQKECKKEGIDRNRGLPCPVGFP